MRNITITAFMAVCLFAATACISPTAHAQCGAVRVFNNMGTNIQLCLTPSPAVVPFCAVVPPGGSVLNIPFIANPAGVVSAGGFYYPFTPVGPLVPGCTICIALTDPSTVVPVCGQVCFDASTCTIRISPCGPPCAP
ncbi:MAG TPA: hypothetical protein VHI13_02775 [Candidatus Kapabacteria bacterium]|nr:hypothetical protein [Candidatus Kapabacteria bacterium]